MEYKIGEYVKLISCGQSYSSIDNIAWYQIVNKYIERYNPININKLKLQIISGFGTEYSLEKNKALKWKIRYCFRFRDMNLFFISSNLNHFLIINEYGIKKIQ